jgi:hypothetical protein
VPSLRAGLRSLRQAVGLLIANSNLAPRLLPLILIIKGGKSPPASSRFASSSTPSTGGQPPVTPPAISYRVFQRATGAPDSGQPLRGLSPLRAKRTAFCLSPRRPTGGKGGMDATVSGRRRPKARNRMLRAGGPAPRNAPRNILPRVPARHRRTGQRQAASRLGLKPRSFLVRLSPLPDRRHTIHRSFLTDPNRPLK